MAIERRLHDAALHASPAAVDDAHFVEAGGPGGVDVLGDDRRDVARRECMQIDLALDRQVDGIRRHVRQKRGTTPFSRKRGRTPFFGQPLFAYAAVTTVLMPPRTEQSPTTVMRRGWIAATRSSRIWLVTAS